jgi:parvulin-like peptidyl-prolyl isomerase
MRIRPAAPVEQAWGMRGKTIVAARTVVLAAVAALAFIPVASARQSSSASSSASSTAAPADPLAAAARRAKEQKKQETKPAKVFTNDNLPAAGGVSTVGAAPADSDSSSDKSAATSTTAAAPAQGESYWRDKFDKLNKKLEQDQSELDVLQRELGQLNLQNYSDPNKAMQQGLSRSDIDKKTAEIAAKQKEIDADKQAISDAQDALRKSGGDPGWAR